MKKTKDKILRNATQIKMFEVIPNYYISSDGYCFSGLPPLNISYKCLMTLFERSLQIVINQISQIPNIGLTTSRKQGILVRLYATVFFSMYNIQHELK